MKIGGKLCYARNTTKFPKVLKAFSKKEFLQTEFKLKTVNCLFNAFISFPGPIQILPSFWGLDAVG